jgi:hypothetical protein
MSLRADRKCPPLTAPPKSMKVTVKMVKELKIERKTLFKFEKS